MRDVEVITEILDTNEVGDHVPDLIRIRETLFKLPITKDGVTVVPFVDTVWIKWYGVVYECSEWVDIWYVACKDPPVHWEDKHTQLRLMKSPISSCYSRKELAC